MDSEKQKPKVSKAQQACVTRYTAANYDRINVSFRKGEREILRAAAAKANKSVNRYITDAVYDALKRDGMEPIEKRNK